MTERVYTFGSHGGLVGIITEPDRGTHRVGAPTVLFSNIGLNHRVGPNRLYVELARKLAASGFRSMRFDLSGFGDSEPRQGGGSDLQRATLDTREAMDFLQKTGSSRFVVAGLCSGVDSAHRVALQDTRVVGAILIDGYAYRNPKFWLRYWTVRNLQGGRWRRYARVRLARVLGRAPLRDLDDMPEIFVRDFPSRDQFAQDLAALRDRSVKLLLVYTTYMDGLYNYPEQFHDTFGFKDDVDVEFYNQADHVFSTEPLREMLLARLVDWMDDRFPTLPHVSSMASDEALRPAMYLVAPAIYGVGRLVRLVAETNVLSA